MFDMSNKIRRSRKGVLLPTRRGFLLSLGMGFAGCVLGCASNIQVEALRNRASNWPAMESGLDPRVDETLAVSKDIPSHAVDMESLAKALVIGDLQEPTDEERHALDDLFRCLSVYPRASSMNQAVLDFAVAMEQVYGNYIDAFKTPWLLGSEGPHFETYAMPSTGAYLCIHERYRGYAVLVEERTEKKEVLSKETEYQYDDERRLIYYAEHPETISITSPEVLWHCTYNMKGLRIDVTQAYACSTQGGNLTYNVSRTKTSYDDDGREVRSQHLNSRGKDLHHLDENTAESDYRQQFEYASKGYLLSEKSGSMSKREDESHSYEVECRRAFDKVGRPVKIEKSEKRDSTSLEKTSLEKTSAQVEYDDKNRPVAWRVSDKNDVEGCRVEYDDKGRLIRYAEYRQRDDEEMSVSFRASTYVDGYHLVVEEEIEEGQTVGVLATQYDSSGRFAFSFGQGTYEYRNKEIVLRDSQGRPVLTEKWDLKKGQDRLLERRTYSYDADTGLLTKMCMAANPEVVLSEGRMSQLGLDESDIYKSVKTYGYLNIETRETIEPGAVDGEIDLALEGAEVSCPTPDTWPGQELLRQWLNGGFSFEEALAFADSLTQKP